MKKFIIGCALFTVLWMVSLFAYVSLNRYEVILHQPFNRAPYMFFIHDRFDQTVTARALTPNARDAISDYFKRYGGEE